MPNDTPEHKPQREARDTRPETVDEKRARESTEAVEAQRVKNEDAAAKLVKAPTETLVVVRDGFSHGGESVPKGTELNPAEDWVRRGVLPYIGEENPIAKTKSLVEAEARADAERKKAEKKVAESRETASNPG